MGFAPSGRPLDEKPHWIKFALNEKGSCEGLHCAARFADGSMETGVFDSNNVVSFGRPNSSACNRVELLRDEDTQATRSVADLLVSTIVGGKMAESQTASSVVFHGPYQTKHEHTLDGDILKSARDALESTAAKFSTDVTSDATV